MPRKSKLKRGRSHLTRRSIKNICELTNISIIWTLERHDPRLADFLTRCSRHDNRQQRRHIWTLETDKTDKRGCLETKYKSQLKRGRSHLTRRSIKNICELTNFKKIWTLERHDQRLGRLSDQILAAQQSTAARRHLDTRSNGAEGEHTWCRDRPP
jgi:hypothetical protein